MKNFLSFCAFFLFLPGLCRAADCVTTLPSSSPIEAIGIYHSAAAKTSRTQINYRYGIQLWHVGECYFGYLTVDAGNEGDPPYGTLSFRKFPADRKIQFASKLNLGMRYAGPNQADIPSKYLFEFTGTLNKKEIDGTFTYTDKLNNNAPTTQKSRLKFEKNSAKDLYLSKKGTTFRDWQEDAERTLKMSGPQW